MLSSDPKEVHSGLVAVKLLHREWSDHVEIGSRMRDEARLLSRLRHENIVEVLAFVTLEGRSAIVMELLEAVDTRVLIDYCREAGERLPLQVALEIAASVASALDAAYNRPPAEGSRPLRVIHRDIKPSNVMVDALGHVKVLDFGVARAEFDTREAKTAELAFGSLEYMPPERLFFEPESAASDIYSLGATLYEMLALEHLGKAKLRLSEQEKFLAERLADVTEHYSLPSDLEADLVDVLKAMLAFDETRRPSASQAVEMLRALASRAGPPSIAVWAERIVPVLVDAARDAASGAAGSGTLAGQTLNEDAAGPDDELRSASRDLPHGLRQSESLHPPKSVARPQKPPDSVWIGRSNSAQTDDLGPELSLPLDDDDAALQDTAVRDMIEPIQLPDEELLPDTVLEMVSSESSLQDTLLQPQPSAVPTVEDRTVRDDTRWNALKRATLAALNETNEMGPVIVEEARRSQGVSPLEMLDNEDIEGAPTVRMMPDDNDGYSIDRNPHLVSAFMPSEADTVLQTSTMIVSERPQNRSVPSAPPRSVTNPRISLTGESSSPRIRVAESETSASSLGYLISAGMLFAASLLIFLTVLVVGVVGITAMSKGPSAMPPLQAGELAAAPPVAAQEGVGPRFISNMVGTRRMMVRCDDAVASGASEVLVVGSSFAECTITAVDDARHRRTAVLTRIEPKRYQCFVGMGSTCE